MASSRHHLPALPGTDDGGDGEGMVWDWADERWEDGEVVTGAICLRFIAASPIRNHNYAAWTTNLTKRGSA